MFMIFWNIDIDVFVFNSNIFIIINKYYVLINIKLFIEGYSALFLSIRKTMELYRFKKKKGNLINVKSTSFVWYWVLGPFLIIDNILCLRLMLHFNSIFVIFLTYQLIILFYKLNILKI